MRHHTPLKCSGGAMMRMSTFPFGLPHEREGRMPYFDQIHVNWFITTPLPQRSTEPLIYTMLLQLIRAVLVPSCHTRFHKHTHTHTVFTVPDWPTFRSNETEFLNILFFNYHNILDFRFTIFENNIFKNSVSLIGMLARAAATSGWFDASV